MGKVIELAATSAATISPEKILNGALNAALTEVVVIGQRPDGSVYFAMSTAEPPSVNWMLDCAKRLLMDGIIEDDTCHG
jgi:hypothetical protein